MSLLLLVLLAYLLPAFGLNCTRDSNPIAHCGNVSSNYTVDLIVQNYVLKHENVTLTATVNTSNRTVPITQLHFIRFQYLPSGSNKWRLIDCGQPDPSTSVTHKWGLNVSFTCLAQLINSDNELLACSSQKTVQIAQPISGFSVSVDTEQRGHHDTKSSYAIGNVSFVTDVEVTFIWFPYHYLYIYSFGDNDSVTIERALQNRIEIYTHTYANVCSVCQYEVIVIAVVKDINYYCKSGLTNISVIEPVMTNNSDVTINFGKKLYKEYSAKLQMMTTATPPFTVCWILHKHSDGEDEPCPLPKVNGTSCETLNSSHLYEPTVSFPGTGLYQLSVSFDNDASCVTKTYNLSVGTISVPVGLVAGGVVAIIVSSIVIVLLITSILGYIQYQRYKNKHTETANFNFVILPPINTDSRWARFKRVCQRKWYKFTRRRVKEGLVCKLSGSGHYTFTASGGSTISYGTLLQSERSCKDLQASQLQDYISGQYDDDKDDR